MSILDIVLIVFLVVALIIGLKKGFAKMISGALCIIIALGGSVAAAAILTGVVQGLDFFAQFHAITTSWFALPAMTVEVESAEVLANVLSADGAGIFSVMTGLATQIFDGMQQAGLNTLGAYLGYLVSTAIIAFGIWLVSYIILKYVSLGLKKLLCLIANVPVIKSIDRIVGAVFSVTDGYIVVFGVIYSAFGIVCAMFFPELGATVALMANQSALFTYVHNTNFIGEFLCGLFQVDYATFAPIAPIV